MKAKLEYEREEMMNINRAHSIDHKYLWALVNMSKKKMTGIHPIHYGKITITNPDEVVKMWKGYFEEFYTPRN